MKVSTPSSGKVCRKHPRAERFGDGSCKGCKTEYKRRWRKANPEKERALRQTVAERERKHLWRKLNVKVALEATRKWKRANLEKVNVGHAKRRAQKLKAAPLLTAAEQARVAALYAEAKRLTRETGVLHHVDHDKPLARGGKHHPDNLLVVPASMNLAKGARYDSTLDFILS